MKTKRDDFKTIAEELKKASSILLFTHIHMDGDALGSSAALCKALRQMGKDCWILLEDSIPQNLLFLDHGYCTEDADVIPEPDVCMCLDCGEESRFPGRVEAFHRGKVTLCVDHHETSKGMCDFNHIDGAAAATGELVYTLLKELDAPIDQEIGEALFAAITTDTGNFQYTNATKETHEIVASLYDAGIEPNKVSIEIYETIRPQRIQLEAKILGSMKLFCQGRLAMAYVSQEMLRECDGKMEETEGIVSVLRSIAGVEVAILFKEYEEETIKASLRAKGNIDVAAISSIYGGGGHKKAAGCTIHSTLAEAWASVGKTARESIENHGI